MHNIKKLFVMLFILCGLTACEDKYTNAYLTEHPAFLLQEFNRCESLNDKTPEQMAQCNMVMAAADKVRAILEEEQADPQQFGLHIMDTESAYAIAKADWHAASSQLDDLKAKNAPAVEIQSAQDKLNAMKKQLEDKQQELKVLLAVAGLNSPE